VVTTITYITLAVLAFTSLTEWLHVRRCRKVGRLAFGPTGAPRKWTVIAPYARALAITALAWGLLTLLHVGPRATRSQKVPEGGYRHLIIALDVSPSMKLEDAGTGGKQTRAKRAGEVLNSVLQRVATDQVRISIIAFYTDAKPVVVDTFDMEVVRNALDDLPLDIAFDVGKTEILKGIQAAAELAKPWQPDSTTLVVVSDGDTVPDSGMPEMPRSIQRSIIVGVGDSRTGTFIDGHQSRQDSVTLRQVAGRLKGKYFDANEHHLASDLLTALSRTLPLRDDRKLSRRELALLCVGMGGFVLAGLPIALALAGSAWHGGSRSKKLSGLVSAREVLPKTKSTETEKLTYA
jgi:Ca-activated chloride channel family protein